MRGATKVITTIVNRIERWTPPEGFTFNPSRPEGVRFHDETTGEMSIGKSGIRQLELDLESGDRPIIKGFLNDTDARERGSFWFRIVFWSAVICFGLWLVYRAAKHRLS